jgi:hypothetical protein
VGYLVSELSADPVWVGDNPYLLIIEPYDQASEPLVIDLDVPGWVTTHAVYLRIPGNWYLLTKSPNISLPRLTMTVANGEQPYYTARHIGVTGSGGSNEIKAYGIGKKQLDGSVVQLWCMPNGTVCGGNDVDALGVAAIRRMGPR